MSVGAFGIEKEGLEELLKEAAVGKSQLPEFQRGWVWADRNIAGLIASISLGYPVGTVMMLRTGGNVKFKERPVEGVKLDKSIKAERLILKDEDNREDTIKLLTEDKKLRTFGGEFDADYSSPESEYKARMFPLNKVYDWHGWYHEYMEYWEHDKEASKTFLRFQLEILDKFNKYQIPVIELPSETAKDAVCQVFEKVNTGGVTLTVFELLTATFAADEYDLRSDWEGKKKVFNVPGHKVLKDFSNTDLLQAICLLSTRERREAFLEKNSDAERAPRMGCKRTDMLALSLDEYKKYGNTVVSGLIEASKFLHQNYIFDSKFVPYGAQLIPLSAIFSILGHEAETHQAQAKISQWFWCGIFGELYGGSTETRFAFDVSEVVNWVRGSAELPRTILEAQFMRERLWTLRSRNSAAYKGLYAQLLSEGAQDWLSGKSISDITYFDDGIDIHHIFPKDWAEKQNIPSSRYNSILNKTPLSARTNRIIGGSAPSVYIMALAKKSDVDESFVLSSIGTHRISADKLITDDFEAHMEFRSEQLVAQVRAAMGKDVGEGSSYIEEDDDSDEDTN